MEEEENDCNKKKIALQNKKCLSFSVNPIEVTKQAIPQDYIMDFIDEKKEEDDMSNMIKKLKKIMNGLENFTKS